MPGRFAQLWSWQGTLNAKSYAIAGVTAFAVKFFLDKFVAWAFFAREWHPWSYFQPLGPAGRVTGMLPDAVDFVFVLLLLALPFISLGVTLTVQRLRDAGQPVWLVVLFFVPAINLLFFLLLCVMATQAKSLVPQWEARPWPQTRPLDKWIPRSGFGAALFSIGLTIVIGLISCVMGTEVLRSYGWGLFVALPFCLGLFSVLTYSYHQRRSFRSCMGVALAPIGLLGAVLLVVLLEGVICLAMAAPFAIALAAAGGTLGYCIQEGFWAQKGSPVAVSIVLLFTPAFQGAEQLVKLQPEHFEVRTAIEVNAPPQKVWAQVVAFSEIPPPKESLFRAGIAYPIRAEISGYGAGAVRHCIFSTGSFEEPIEVWDQPRLLRFGVTANPAPLNELNPFGRVQPPHLHGYFVSRQGQFQLTALPGGRTRLEGTTWYQHTMWPATYWHFWSDYIIHKIHLRVLEHIRAEAESGQSSAEFNGNRIRQRRGLMLRENVQKSTGNESTPANTVVVTGAFSYTGKYTTQLLLSRGYRIRTLTYHPNRANPFDCAVEVFPYAFNDPQRLTQSLQGACTLINTYWVRFPRGSSTFETAVQNTRTLIQAAKNAGVRRIVHVSIANPSLESPLGYYRGKAQLEQAVVESGLSYTILRPTVIFGSEDILINNIAWFARHFPAFAIPGDGQYRIRPIFVRDMARLLADAVDREGNEVLDCVGPETFTFEELVRQVVERLGRSIQLVHVPTASAYVATRLAGWLVGDVVLTWEEYKGLMGGLLAPEGPSTGQTRLTEWLAANRDSVGRRYASEIARHYVQSQVKASL